MAEERLVNERMVNERETQINRNAIGHRAAWMGLIYDEAVKAGMDIEDVMRKAIARKGEKDGEKFRSRCEDASDLSSFRKVFLDDLGMSTFDMEVDECSTEDLKIQFHYCPLLAAWKDLGMDDDQCARLCDIAMDGDRNIAKAMGLKFDLNGAIAEGCATCRLHFHK